MAQQPGQSKRERHKQRRDAKVAEQRAQAARARRNRLVLFTLVALIVVALIAAVLNNQRAQRSQVAQQREAVAARLDELGCTPDTELPDGGQGHLANAQLAQSPPETLYPDRPATSGQHHPNWIRTGVYDVRIDERFLVHNLEHGYVVVHYNADAPAEQLEALKTRAAELIDGDFPKIVVAPYSEDLPGEANVSFTAWNFRQSCRDFDPEVLDVFVRAHHSGAGVAPERTLPPHLEAGGGTLDPGGEDLLLPPLGERTPTGGMTESTTTESPPASPTESTPTEGVSEAPATEPAGDG